MKSMQCFKHKWYPIMRTKNINLHIKKCKFFDKTLMIYKNKSLIIIVKNEQSLFDGHNMNKRNEYKNIFEVDSVQYYCDEYLWCYNGIDSCAITIPNIEYDKQTYLDTLYYNI